MQIASVYNVLKSFSDWLENVVKFITAILILLCSITVFLQVVNRYILVKQTLFEWESISWTDELARLLMVSLAYFAMGMCYKHGQLSRADMVYARLKGCSKKVLYYIETVLMSIFLIAAIKYGIEFASVNVIYRTESLNIPGNILYLIPVIGFVIMLYQMFVEVIGVASGQVEPFACVAGEIDEKGAE